MNVASKYSLWPLTLVTGEQNGGKSTAMELYMTVLTASTEEEPHVLPKKEDAIVASVSTRSFVAYDNIDNVDAEHYDNTLCQIATGGVIDKRKLYTTNQRPSFRIRTHAMFTARVCPFSRSDVMRRVIQLEVEPMAEGAALSKDGLREAVLASRTAILAELVLRTRNILVAHIQQQHLEFEYISGMAEYERFFLICASWEKTLDLAKKAWSAYGGQYKESISEANPLVYAIRLWLGVNKANRGREITSTRLFAELANIFVETGQKLIYTAPHAFSTAIGKQQSSLRVLGYRKHRSATHNMVSFLPDPKELVSCRELYLSMLETFGARASRDNTGLEGHARDKARQMRNEDRKQQENANRQSGSTASSSLGRDQLCPPGWTVADWATYVGIVTNDDTSAFSDCVLPSVS